MVFDPKNEDIIMLQDDNTICIINKNKVCLWSLSVSNNSVFHFLPSCLMVARWLYHIMHKVTDDHTARQNLNIKAANKSFGSVAEFRIISTKR